MIPELIPPSVTTGVFCCDTIARNFSRERVRHAEAILLESAQRVVRENGRRRNLKLDEDETAAYRIWSEMVAVGGVEHVTASVAAMASAFVAWAMQNTAKGTWGNYGTYCAQFANVYGQRFARDIKPFHVTRWLDEKDNWSQATKRTAIISVKRMFSWSVEMGLMPSDPLKTLKRPGRVNREVVITPEQHAAMIAKSDGRGQTRRAACFRPVLIALKHSGGRPSTVASVRAEDVAEDLSMWVLNEHKTRKKTRRPLLVYLSPCLQTLTRIALHQRKSGELFRNARSEPWTRNAIRIRMKRLRESLQLPKGTIAYAYRHTYATNAMLNGVDIATTAELLGHTDVRMVSEVYGHLAGAPEHMKAAAKRAVG